MNDPIGHPAHYTQGKIEVLEFIEDQELGYHLSSVIKYICRAGKKDLDKSCDDLKKARFYLNRMIEMVEAFDEKRLPCRPNQMAEKKESTSATNASNSVKPVNPPDFVGCAHTVICPKCSSEFDVAYRWPKKRWPDKNLSSEASSI